MNDWRTVKLADLGPITTGKTPPSSKPGSFGGSIPFVTPSDMIAGRYVWNTSRSLTEAGLRTVSKRMLPAGCVLVSCIGSDMGKAYVASRSCFTNQQINSIEVTDRGAHPLYVYYNLSGRKAELQRLASGSSAQPILNKSNFAQISLELPPIAEQTAIADLLGSLDDKIELNLRMNETLEAMAQAIFRDWFVDFGPTRRKIDGATDPVEIIGGLVADPDRARELAALFPAALVDGLPEGWEEITVGELAKLRGGKHLPKSDFVEGGCVPVFGGAGLMGFTDKYNAEGYVITMGRVGAYCGRFVAHRGRAWVNNNASHIVPNATTPAEWLFLTLRHLNMDVIKKGAAQPFVSNGDLAARPVVYPGGTVLRAFQHLTLPLITKMEACEVQSETLAATRDLLLPKLMSGEVRICDAEAVLEAAQ